MALDPLYTGLSHTDWVVDQVFLLKEFSLQSVLAVSGVAANGELLRPGYNLMYYMKQIFFPSDADVFKGCPAVDGADLGFWESHEWR